MGKNHLNPPLLVAEVKFVNQVFTDDEGFECEGPVEGNRLYLVDQELLDLLRKRLPIAQSFDESFLPDVIDQGDIALDSQIGVRH
ncbi:hypothetical protein [Geomonas anaerohicana]|uniref:Uncharacterized protein n=1 Tax=Geomonas anaerohicana TaxID=2798583 RepID=A0ABS0YD84_9BACT|nr:hypothetical protein [Geomonas anaerohicana]MBJ6750250.1 hypothetical protein [Geomonas anaerohicana]